MRAGILRRTVSRLSVAVASLLVFGSGATHAYVDDLVVESDYYQLAPKDQKYDRSVLEEKGRIAETQGNVLAQIAKLDDENIMKIFTFFHRKFQTIITTTTIKDTAMEKKIKTSQKNSVSTIEINDKTV